MRNSDMIEILHAQCDRQDRDIQDLQNEIKDLKKVIDRILQNQDNVRSYLFNISYKMYNEAGRI